MQQRQQALRARRAGAAYRQRGAGATAAPSPGQHPFTRGDENARLFAYESRTKEAFDRIEPTLREIATYQYQSDFPAQAQRIARQELGFELPGHLLDHTWPAPPDMRALYAWCVFETFKRFADTFYLEKPLAEPQDGEFQNFLESCGFHIMDVSPCADGRLAHIVRYVLRLPYRAVRRRSYAGAMFDVEDSLQKWMEVELARHREGVPNQAGEPTRYLKAAVYHYSRSDPDREGCAAHGSDADIAALRALSRLQDFRQAVENSFCCGASIDLLLIGIDTDSDAIRIHLPDAHGGIDLERYVDAREAYEATRHVAARDAAQALQRMVSEHAQALEAEPSEGMVRLIARLLMNNISQVDYVRTYFNGRYGDVGHFERFIGMGIGFEEVQLRNLTYFAYLTTVEQGAKDVDVGLKIFTGLNIARGLPAPVIIRYDYHGNVPGARDRAIARCECLGQALKDRFPQESAKGLLHTLLVVRNISEQSSIEVVGGSLEAPGGREDHQ
jgi:carboxysome shell carbonic anhydrase